MSKRTKSVRIRKYQVTPYQQTALRSLMPPEDLTVSQWAERYRVLDSKAAAPPLPSILRIFWQTAFIKTASFL